MKQRILSIALALCLCFSSKSVAYASQEDTLPQKEMLAEELTSEPVAHDGDVDISNLTPTGVYEAMIALKEQDAYKEGTIWTDYEPYSDSGYHWKGGNLDGVSISAVGCVAFAFILSDAAFGSLPNRMYTEGEFDYEDIKVGDILRVNGDAHTVIVLEVSDAGVIVAEGNYNSTVHWERAISKEEVMISTSHYITRYPDGYIPPDDPSAREIIGNGTLDGELIWKLTKAGTMTISGSGAMPDFNVTYDEDGIANGDQPWYSYSDKIRTVIIEDGITSISSCAFRGCRVLSAKIPSSVTTIGNSAFRESSIISVSIPSSVETIGDSAFRACQNLSSVTVSEGVKTIEQNAFCSCTSLTTITLPASIEEVGAGAFLQCTALINVKFTPGDKQVELGDNLFTQCYCLMSVTLPQSIDHIGEGVFQNCLKLLKVIIPQGAESIGNLAFASCPRLTALLIPDSVTTIAANAFSGTSALANVYYTGTETQWSSVFNHGVVTATMHYNYILYTVTFKDGDTVLMTVRVENGTAAEAPENLVKAGYIFKGWDTDFTNVTSDLTVNAVWGEQQEGAERYTVTFKDGDAVLKTVEVESGTAAEPPLDPEKAGYIFKGWDTKFDNVIGDLTVTAQWAKAYTVIFMNGENEIGRQIVEEGASATAPSDPVKTGYTFKGWDKTFTSVTSDLAVTAVWEKEADETGNDGTDATKTVAAKTVTINAKKLYLIKGKSAALKALVTPSNSTDKLTWSSSKSSIVSVSNGKIKAKKTGSATITAKAGGKKATCKVYVVKKAKKSSSIKLNKKKASIKVGNWILLTSTLKPSSSTDTIKWKSSNSKVASVSNGFVTAKKKGKATITATASGKKATCTITVK